MTSPIDNGNRWTALGVALAALALISAIVQQEAPAAVLINETPSLARGLYARAENRMPRMGAVVAVPQPPAARAYLRSLGAPEDLLLIKRVAAVAGDVVCRRGPLVETPLRRVEARARDRRGVELPTWAGCRRLAQDELFLLGDTPDSFDSRYFGPVRAPGGGDVYQEWITW